MLDPDTSSNLVGEAKFYGFAAAAATVVFGLFLALLGFLFRFTKDETRRRPKNAEETKLEATYGRLHRKLEEILQIADEGSCSGKGCSFKEAARRWTLATTTVTASTCGPIPRRHSVATPTATGAALGCRRIQHHVTKDIVDAYSFGSPMCEISNLLTRSEASVPTKYEKGQKRKEKKYKKACIYLPPLPCIGHMKPITKAIPTVPMVMPVPELDVPRASRSLDSIHKQLQSKRGVLSRAGSYASLRSLGLTTETRPVSMRMGELLKWQQRPESQRRPQGREKLEEGEKHEKAKSMESAQKTIATSTAKDRAKPRAETPVIMKIGTNSESTASGPISAPDKVPWMRSKPTAKSDMNEQQGRARPHKKTQKSGTMSDKGGSKRVGKLPVSASTKGLASMSDDALWMKSYKPRETANKNDSQKNTNPKKAAQKSIPVSNKNQGKKARQPAVSTSTTTGRTSPASAAFQKKSPKETDEQKQQRKRKLRKKT